MVTHWPVRIEVPLAGLARDAEGYLTEDGVATVFAAVRTAYLEGCTTLTGVDVTFEDVRLERGSVPVDGDHVVAVPQRPSQLCEIDREQFLLTAHTEPRVKAACCAVGFTADDGTAGEPSAQ